MAEAPDGARPEVWITGLGLSTALGFGREANWAALAAGRSGVGRITRFDTTGLRATIAACIDGRGLGALAGAERTERLAEMVLDEALAQAGLGSPGLDALLVLGQPPLEISWSERLALADAAGGAGATAYADLVAAGEGGRLRGLYEAYAAAGIAARLSERFADGRAPMVVNTACATGATAIQLAVEAIRRGEAEVAAAVASDASVLPDTIVRFSLLAALSMSNDRVERAARPFCADRDGFVLGEGAAALVLESARAARARGAAPLAVVRGVGESADTYHLTRSSPDAGATIRAIRSALDDAGLRPSQIDYVNAHGTGTPENDRNEALALAAVFGEGAACPPVSATKSMIGHTMSAAGAVEAAVCVLAMRHGMLPPTINHDRPDPEIPLDVVPDVARPGRLRHVLSNSFGFGGQNVCLVLSAPDA